jgi:hypothetical protein
MQGTCKHSIFFIIPFYLQSVPVHSANCVKKTYTVTWKSIQYRSSVTNEFQASYGFSGRTFRVPWNVGKSLSSCAAGSFWERAQPHALPLSCERKVDDFLSSELLVPEYIIFEYAEKSCSGFLLPSAYYGSQIAARVPLFPIHALVQIFFTRVCCQNPRIITKRSYWKQMQQYVSNVYNLRQTWELVVGKIPHPCQGLCQPTTGRCQRVYDMSYPLCFRGY